MTIEVEGPDGAINEFPDGTPDAVIAKAMQSVYGPPKAAPASTSGGLGDLVAGALSRAKGVAGGLADKAGLGPQGPSPYQQSSDLDAQMRGQPAAPVTAKRQEGGERRSGALAGLFGVADQSVRGVAQGAATMAGLPVDLTTLALNLTPGVAQIRTALGLEPTISKPFLGSDFNKAALDAANDATIGGINAVTGANLDLPVREGDNIFERGANRIGQEIGGAALPAGAAIGKAAQVGMEGARAIQNPIARHFVEQAAANPSKFLGREVGAAGAAGAGAAGVNEVTRAAGVDEHGIGHAAGDLAGALGALSLYGIGSHAIGKARDVYGAITGSDKFANQVVRDAVVDRLASAAGAPTVPIGKRDVFDTGDIVAAIERGRAKPIGDTVPGYQDTLADVTRNPGIAAQEYARRTAGSVPLAQRGAANEGAVNAAIDALAPEGQAGALRDRLADRRSGLLRDAAAETAAAQARFEEAAAQLQAQMHPDARGQDIRAALEEAKAAARAVERNAWEGVTTGEADIRPLVEAFGNVRSGLTETARDLFDPSHLTGIPSRFLPAEVEAGAEAAAAGPTRAGLSGDERAMGERPAALEPAPAPTPTPPAPAAPAMSAEDRIMMAIEGAPVRATKGRNLWDVRAAVSDMPEDEFRTALLKLQAEKRTSLSQYSDPKSYEGKYVFDPFGNGDRNDARHIAYVPGEMGILGNSWPNGRPRAPEPEASPSAQAQEAPMAQPAQRQPEPPPPPREPTPLAPETPAAPENGPVSVSLRETADLRSALSAEHRDALSSANPARARVIEQYIDALDTYARDVHPDVEAYDNARDISRRLNDRFTRLQTDVAQVLDRNQGVYRQSDASVPGRFVRPDTGDQTGLERLMAESYMNANPERARNAVADQIRADTSGLQSPEAVARYVEEHSRVLDSFPDLRAQLVERANAQHVAGNAARRQEDLTASLGTENTRGSSSVGKYLQHGTEQTSRAIQGVFTSSKPAEAARELLEFAGRDRAAIDGLRRAIWEEAERVGRRKGETTASTDGVQPWMPGKLKAFVDKPNVRAVLQEAYRDDPEHLENLDRLAEVLRHANVGARGRAPNSSGTAQGVLDAIKGAVSPESIQSGVMSVKRGQIGVPWLVTSIAARLARNSVKAAQGPAINRMLDEALVNPEAAAALLRENNPVNRAYLSRSSKLWGIEHADQLASALNDNHDDEDPVKAALKRARR
ncbi:hypothetical protein [Methylobacterium brachiatum]|uniref:hypothetical protein n=1 Tax=Methylobacterium brachiatum TaxID=269660 RepID=UPI0008DF09D5|nr:hypothetical protein [Methylobacterium brachiatum]SFI05867.1 hypothetical protein SAMN02799642_00581 [Methylobacterium brachiatum]